MISFSGGGLCLGICVPAVCSDYLHTWSWSCFSLCGEWVWVGVVSGKQSCVCHIWKWKFTESWVMLSHIYWELIESHLLRVESHLLRIESDLLKVTKSSSRNVYLSHSLVPPLFPPILPSPPPSPLSPLSSPFPLGTCSGETLWSGRRVCSPLIPAPPAPQIQHQRRRETN